MNIEHEFGTIDLLINSDFETRGIDSFSLALIKAERQIRKIFTFLIFQNPSFSSKDIKNLREALTESRRVYFEGFIAGINNILVKSIEDIYGANYHDDLKKILEYIKYRNKIFHGQLTDKNLSRQELIQIADEIKSWCNKISLGMEKEIGFDGFGRNSYQKSINRLALNNLNKFDTIDNFKLFIKTILER